MGPPVSLVAVDAEPSPPPEGPDRDGAPGRATVEPDGAGPTAPFGGAPGEEPTTALSARAVALWRLPWAGALLGVLLLSIAVAAGGRIPELPDALSWVGVALLWVAVGAGLALVPPLRHRRWRYAVRGDEIDLSRGVWVRRRTVVPVARIQHVDVERTPVADTFGLAELHVHTAAGTVTIPALDAAVAAAIRDHVADLAKVPDDL